MRRPKATGESLPRISQVAGSSDAPNKPNFPVFWPENGDRAEEQTQSKPISVGGRERGVGVSAIMQNKANVPRFWAKNAGGGKKQSQFPTARVCRAGLTAALASGLRALYNMSQILHPDLPQRSNRKAAMTRPATIASLVLLLWALPAAARTWHVSQKRAITGRSGRADSYNRRGGLPCRGGRYRRRSRRDLS